MRHLLAAAAAGLLTAACAATTSVHVHRADLPLAEEPPELFVPPHEGPVDAEASRAVACTVEVGEALFDLGAWCRLGVWTTLDRLEPHAFTVREAWGRLGERAPRRLLTVADQAMAGVVVRVRPERDGSLSFQAEAAEVAVGPDRPVAEFFGRGIVLPQVTRWGLRLGGRAPAGWSGCVAAWEPGMRVWLGPPAEHAVPPADILRFSSAGAQGFLAGRDAAAAETFLEVWNPVTPHRVEAEGVDRIDCRLQRTRRAAGFRPDGAGGHDAYGAPFRLGRDA